MGETFSGQTIPDDERAEMGDDGLGITGATNGAAVPTAGFEADGLNGEQQTLQDRIGDFLNPKVPMSLDEQLATVTELWGTLTDRKMPALDENQKAAIDRVLQANPTRRVMPSPFLSFEDRKDIAEKARTFVGARFTTDFDALWAPDETKLLGKLLRNPEDVAEEGGKSYVLRYRLPGSKQVAGRTDFIQALARDGHSVEAEDGTPWVYPIMDVRIKSPRSYEKAGNLLTSVEATIISESLIAMHLLHQANGTPNTDSEVDFANEAVYKLGRNGSIKGVEGGVGVAYNPSSQQISLGFYDAGLRGVSVRLGESGL